MQWLLEKMLFIFKVLWEEYNVFEILHLLHKINYSRTKENIELYLY